MRHPIIHVINYQSLQQHPKIKVQIQPEAGQASEVPKLGVKTDDGKIAWAPGNPVDGALTTITELLREREGFFIGVVSTVPFSHATPAAHVKFFGADRPFLFRCFLLASFSEP